MDVITEDMTEEEKVIYFTNLRRDYLRNYKTYKDSNSFVDGRILLFNAVSTLNKMVKVLEKEGSDSALLEEFPLDYLKTTLDKRRNQYKELTEKREIVR